MKCKKCGHDNPTGSKFCNNSGTKMPVGICCPNPKCGTENLPIGSKFCPDCGTRIVVTDSQLSNPEAQKSFDVYGIKFNMIRVEGGAFTMGATPEIQDPCDDEKTTHQVVLSNYYIGQTQVTQALWKAVMGNNPSNFKGDNLPVETVSWNDCQNFISKLNALTGKEFRLPTEAEWEFAARGGNKSNHTQYSGSKNIGDVAWYYGNSGEKTHPVATKPGNELGIFDMSGNVWEWCNDWYDEYNYIGQTNPTGPNSGTGRVLRGGSWYCITRDWRVSSRNCSTPDSRGSSIGLRLCLSE